MSNWHAPPDLLDRYARAPEAVDATTASSIEQHLLGCEGCRGAVAVATGPDPLASSWAAIADRIDRPRRSATERLLVRSGLPGDVARLVGATTGLRVAWLGLVLLATVAATVASRQDDGLGAFLVVAPLLPVGAVAVAFSPAADPAGEAGRATPLHGAGVALRRVVAVLAPTLLVLLVGSSALSDRGAIAAAWVLPGLALAGSGLLLATYVRVATAAAATALAWAGGIGVVLAFDGRRVAVEHTVLFGPPAQVVALLAAAVAAAGVHARRDRFATLEVGW